MFESLKLYLITSKQKKKKTFHSLKKSKLQFEKMSFLSRGSIGIASSCKAVVSEDMLVVRVDTCNTNELMCLHVEEEQCQRYVWCDGDLV